MPRARPPDERRILCTSCGGLLVVARQAKSVSCPHCNARVICEALDIKDYVAVRRLRTANRLRITRKGHVVAVVQAEDLLIEGRLRGGAVVLGPIRVTRRAEVHGDLRGASLVVEEGATITGEMRIGPDEVPERARLEQRLPGELLDEIERTPGRSQTPAP